MENLSPLNISRDSVFIFDLREKEYFDLIKDIKDINTIKPKDEEISFLENVISDYKSKNKEEENDPNKTLILHEYKIVLINFNPGIKKLNEKFKTILNIFNGFKHREKISLKKICRKYYKMTGYNISKSYVAGILKNKLNIKFLKTNPKTSILNSISSKIRGFIFLKTVLNALRLNLKIIYIDESNFQIKNNHLKVWRKNRELPLFKVGKPGRRNIISAITNEELLLYQINKGTNTSETFLNFMKELLGILKKKSIDNSLFIMDNCTIHLTKMLKAFYKENNLKILTIVPHCSDFNAIELLFGFIKQRIYKKIFSSLPKLIEYVKNILEENSLNEIINRIFIKALNTYKLYIDNNIHFNLNEN